MGQHLCYKRIVRLVCGAKHLEHTSTLFKQLRIFKFVDVVKVKTAIIIYKAYHNALPNSLQNMFKLYVSTYNIRTRQRDTFRSHRARTNIKSMCISVCGGCQSFHENITSCRRMQAFKQRISFCLCIRSKNQNNYKQTLFVVSTVCIKLLVRDL